MPKFWDVQQLRWQQDGNISRVPAISKVRRFAARDYKSAQPQLYVLQHVPFCLLAMWTSFNEASHGKHDALWVLMVIPSWEASSQKKMYACSALAIHIYIYIYILIYLFIYVFMYLFIYLCILYTICIYIYIYIYYIICANSCGRYQEVPSDVSTGISYSADCLLVCICGQRFGIVRGKWIGIFARFY